MKQSFFIKAPQETPLNEKDQSIHISSIEDILTEVKKFIYTRILPSHEEIDRELAKLSKLEKLFNDPPPDLLTSSFLKKQKGLSQKLAKQCADLHTRKKVITFAETGEHLVHQAPNLSEALLRQKIQNLENSMRDFCSKERLSVEDAKFIRFANICIQKAKNREPLVHPLNEQNVQKITQVSFLSKKEPTQNAYLLGEELYVCARFLYKDDIESFHKTLNDFPLDIQKEVTFHVQICEGSLQNIESEEEKLSCIQGILGYAHQLTDYFMSHEPYPTFVEIHEIFQDLELIEIEEDIS